jgi:hypothetical protein
MQNEIPKTGFMKTIEKIVEAAGVLEEFQTNPEFHLRLEQPGYMPLVIEAYNGSYTGIGKRNISVAHYYTQNGDLIADPDILMDEAGLPIEIQQPALMIMGFGETGGYARIRWINEKGERMWKPKLFKDVKGFMTHWSANLKEQGWVQVARQYKKNAGQQKLATA